MERLSLLVSGDERRGERKLNYDGSEMSTSLAKEEVEEKEKEGKATIGWSRCIFLAPRLERGEVRRTNAQVLRREKHFQDGCRSQLRLSRGDVSFVRMTWGQTSSLAYLCHTERQVIVTKRRRDHLHQSIKRDDQWSFAFVQRNDDVSWTKWRSLSRKEMRECRSAANRSCRQGSRNRSQLCLRSARIEWLLFCLSLIGTRNVCLVNTSWNHMPNGSQRWRWIEVSSCFDAGVSARVSSAMGRWSPCFGEWSIGVWWSVAAAAAAAGGRTSSIFDGKTRMNMCSIDDCVHLWTSIWQAIINFTALPFHPTSVDFRWSIQGLFYFTARCQIFCSSSPQRSVNMASILDKKLSQARRSNR